MTEIPKGYWLSANGSLVPQNKVKTIDKDRTEVVTRLCEHALTTRSVLERFKQAASAAVDEFIARSLSEYDVAHGGKKGNVTLISFDGRYKIVRQTQETITFDERLQAAKALIDECIQTWSKGSNANIKALVNDAFQVDKVGNISTGRVLGLRRLKIEDEKWRLAMDAIGDSLQIVGSKSYIRFYERLGDSEEYTAISLDIAAL